MKLSEWNEVLAYAKSAVEELKNNKIKASYVVDKSAIEVNSHGITFNVYDIDDNVFKRYSAGCESNSFALMTKIAIIKERILKEC